jgi:hypothetical protein
MVVRYLEINLKQCTLLGVMVFRITANGGDYCRSGGLKAQMFNFKTKVYE